MQNTFWSVHSEKCPFFEVKKKCCEKFTFKEVHVLNLTHQIRSKGRNIGFLYLSYTRSSEQTKFAPTFISLIFGLTFRALLLKPV